MVEGISPPRAGVHGHRLAQGAGQGLKGPLDDVVAVFPAELLDVEGALAAAGKSQEELLAQLRVKGPYLLRGQRQLTAEHPPAGEVHSGEDQRLVHGEEGAAIAGDAGHISQGLGEGVPQADPHVLHCVVVIHPGVPLAFHSEVKPAVAGEEGEHVVQKAAAGIDLAFSGAVQVQLQLDIGLRGFAGNFRRSHGQASFTMSRTRWRKPSICSLEPMVTRT